MSEQKIARTVARAQVGELLWCYHAEHSRYDENKNYLGRGVWSVVTVLSIARVYLDAGNPAYPISAERYNRDTGACKTQSGYSPSIYVYGSDDRQNHYWRHQSYAIADAVKRCADIDTLKTIAFALGMDGPPDFSVVPLPTTEDPDMPQGRARQREG